MLIICLGGLGKQSNKGLTMVGADYTVLKRFLFLVVESVNKIGASAFRGPVAQGCGIES